MPTAPAMVATNYCISQASKTLNAGPPGKAAKPKTLKAQADALAADGAEAEAAVNTYDIIATLADPDNKLSNYNLTNTSGTLTVTKAPLTVQAKELSISYKAQKTLGVNYTCFPNELLQEMYYICKVAMAMKS